MNEIIKPCECKEPGFCERYQRTMTPNLFHLCQTREEYRKLWDDKLRRRKENPPTPSGENRVQSSVSRKVQKYARAVMGWISAGRPVRSDELTAEIYEKYCKECDDKKNNSCVLCGCKVSKSKIALVNKIKMATESCPKGLWISSIILNK